MKVHDAKNRLQVLLANYKVNERIKCQLKISFLQNDISEPQFMDRKALQSVIVVSDSHILKDVKLKPVSATHEVISTFQRGFFISSGSECLLLQWAVVLTDTEEKYLKILLKDRLACNSKKKLVSRSTVTIYLIFGIRVAALCHFLFYSSHH